MIDHFEASFHAAAFLRAKLRNLRAGAPVICSTVSLGWDPLLGAEADSRRTQKNVARKGVRVRVPVSAHSIW
jgi:hypothetical protein